MASPNVFYVKGESPTDQLQAFARTLMMATTDQVLVRMTSSTWFTYLIGLAVMLGRFPMAFTPRMAEFQQAWNAQLGWVVWGKLLVGEPAAEIAVVMQLSQADAIAIGTELLALTTQYRAVVPDHPEPAR
ncbi:MAG: hypothetical protein H7099_17460 [Gemmatimonadaceae bacterium]|nr:hypothetical protein [Gemmatimonadaceae bacterium]